MISHLKSGDLVKQRNTAMKMYGFSKWVPKEEDEFFSKIGVVICNKETTHKNDVRVVVFWGDMITSHTPRSLKNVER